MQEKNSQPRQLVIPKERAVFWMDAHGRWCNVHGPFEHKKIIAYFNASIARDEGGYFVAQERDGLQEKVYFRYQVTPIFAVSLLTGNPDRLKLNTGEIITLAVEQLYVQDDHLYLDRCGECVKFSERVMLKLADRLKYAKNAYYFRKGRTWHPIREILPASET